MRKIILISRNIYSNITFARYKSDSVRVRFAPSPTGYLHLGGLRTALYNFLFAKKYNGKFILRIEDTDQTRLVKGATDQIIKDLEWAGIEVDEGPSMGGSYGPYYQSQRLEIYRNQVEVLLKNGSAYHCFCTDKRLQLLRKEAVRAQQIPKYDNKCRHLSSEDVATRLQRGDLSCIRFKVISDQEESFDDLVYGQISYNISLNEGDPVIVKSDGYPTYHFANVVDDHFMNVSHVLRGVEWQISTTKHLLLYRAFNWKPPKFAHLPLLMNADGTKLSKRQGDVKISYYRENGIFPLALLNFIVHSGGGFIKDLQRHVKPKCYTVDELAEQFEVTRINNSSGKMMSERLLEFNRLALKKHLEVEPEKNKLVEDLKQMLRNKYPSRVEDGSLQLQSDYIKSILEWSVDRVSKLSDLTEKNFEFIWVKPKAQPISDDKVDAVNLFKISWRILMNCKLRA
nr:unnamed protein product [Callosobruchus analis]